jgi:hypothetical protein
MNPFLPRSPGAIRLTTRRTRVRQLRRLRVGWEDDGWGAVNRNGVTLRFPGGGFQRIIVQTREDGVSIDQIVLSSEKYLTKRPGAAKNDSTILQFTCWQEEG